MAVSSARLDHVIVFSEDHLKRILASYIAYYSGCRTHLSLETGSLDTWPIQTL
jgi:hypothetical protein